MKKFAALMLALALLCAALPALAEASDLVGTWYLNEIQMGDEVMSPASLGMEMTIVLNEDGTAIVSSSYGDEQEEEQDNWALGDGVITFSAEGTPVSEILVEDGKLKYDIGGTYMIFGREAPEAAAAMPVAVAAESEDAFLGEWTLTSISAGGAMVPASMLGADGKLTVEPGKLTLVSGEDTTEATTALTEDGKLATDDGVLVLELNDNGWLSITTPVGEDTVMVMYFEKAE